MIMKIYYLEKILYLYENHYGRSGKSQIIRKYEAEDFEAKI
jgi:hypothetical protein